MVDLKFWKFWYVRVLATIFVRLKKKKKREVSYFLLLYSNKLYNIFSYYFPIPFKYYFKSILGKKREKQENFLFIFKYKVRVREVKVLRDLGYT